jgi:hypothetical protein
VLLSRKRSEHPSVLEKKYFRAGEQLLQAVRVRLGNARRDARRASLFHRHPLARKNCGSGACFALKSNRRHVAATVSHTFSGIDRKCTLASRGVEELIQNQFLVRGIGVYRLNVRKPKVGKVQFVRRRPVTHNRSGPAVSSQSTLFCPPILSYSAPGCFTQVRTPPSHDNSLLRDEYSL